MSSVRQWFVSPRPFTLSISTKGSRFPLLTCWKPAPYPLAESGGLKRIDPRHWNIIGASFEIGICRRKFRHRRRAPAKFNALAIALVRDLIPFDKKAQITQI